MCRFFMLFYLAIYFSSFRSAAYIFFFKFILLPMSLSFCFHIVSIEIALQVELNVRKNAEAENQLMAESSKQTNITYQFDGVHTVFRSTLKNENIAHAHTHERNCNTVCHSSSNEEILNIKLAAIDDVVVVVGAAVI